MKKGKVFIISAPAGTGKTTLVNKALHKHQDFKETTSHTTRKPRKNETNGKDYHFIQKEQFEKMINEEKFLEHISLYGEYYGTSKQEIENIQNQGNHAILVIDTQGGLNLKNQNFDAVYIFIQPPSIDELLKRLQKRSTECPNGIEERLTHAEREINDGKKYDHIVVNDNLDHAYQQLEEIFLLEENKI